MKARLKMMEFARGTDNFQYLRYNVEANLKLRYDNMIIVSADEEFLEGDNDGKYL